MRRIDGLSQDLQFKTVNNAMKMIAPSNGAAWLHWVTAQDDNVCPECLAKAAGGKNGYYRLTWFHPQMPLHPGDRCQYELVFDDSDL
jgi:hypothetical protein